MAKEAHFYFARDLVELRSCTFTDESGNERDALSADGFALLLWSCNVANNKTGTFFHQQSTISEDTGISSRNLKRLIAGFEQLGWWTRTGKSVSYRGRGKPSVEYRLTVWPELFASADEMTDSDTTGAEQVPVTDPGSAQVGTSRKTKVNNGKGSTGFRVSQSEPQPEPQPQPLEGQVIQTSQAAWGGKEKAEKKGVESPHLPALLDALVAYEHSNCKTPIRDPRAMESHWRKKWRDRARAALQQNPTASVTDLVAQLTNTPGRTPGTHSPKVITCGACAGKNRNDDGLTQVPDYDAPETPGRRGRAYKVCPDCAGTGQVKATAVA